LCQKSHRNEDIIKIVERKEFDKLVPQDAVHQGIAAIVKELDYYDLHDICNMAENLDNCHILILDQVTDPQNIGAIIRSACAFGYNTIFAVNSVYPYSYKAIPSSMGYIFDVNYIDTTYDELIKIKNDNIITFISADMDGEIIDTPASIKENFAIIIGNEGQGISRELRNLSDKTFAIPMDNGVESLNASVSAGILMFLLK